MVSHRKDTGDSRGQRLGADWTLEAFSSGSLGPSGLCVYFSLHISFILLSFGTLHHRACLWSRSGHSPTQFNRLDPTPQQEGSRGPSLGQVSPTGPTGCFKGGHRAEKVGRSSPGQNSGPLRRWPLCHVGKPKALRSNHPAHDEPDMTLLSWVLSQTDLGGTLDPTV